MLTDLRIAARPARRPPAVAAVTVLCLALGIGVTTTTFTIANALLLVVGSALLLAVGGVLRRTLFGVEPTDPAMLLGAPMRLATVALAATWRPARRAARIEPAVALRAE